ncbi:uncharacterized protein Dwil_GK16606 [Drosophila willistoni]|uniref:Gamma-tubulin complex component n=1 Tax=Drosophila willistoni TaxID=7260 RepID=B4MMW1_DROWI|nr:uncharacterized protein LOC6638683 [Drosophila willistoni]EDW73517.1 uncharacterized protein Dwil_GK16606 [Drosophila willistoni]
MDQVKEEEGQQDRQEVIDENLPKLVGDLLNMEPVKEERDAAFQECLESAKQDLKKDPQFLESEEECVTRNFYHFLARYKAERLHEFGVTFDKLAHMMLKNPMFIDHGQMNFKWRILDFMLSVNFEAFRNVKQNSSEMEKQRKFMLGKIDEIISSSLSEDSESSYSFYDESILEKFKISPICLMSDSNDSARESSSSTSSLTLKVNKLPEDMSGSVVPMNFNFWKEYAEYLESRPCPTDCRLLYEYICMFFAPQNWIHFQVIDHEVLFRKPFECHMPHINLLEPLKDMQMVQKLIDKYACPWRVITNYFSTLTCLFEAMHRLLKPVMEFLIFWGERVTKEANEESPSISCFIEMTVQPFRRLRLMGQLCQDTCILNTDCTTKHERSFHIIATLISATKHSRLYWDKSGSAALLLSSLKSYCQFMANMYRLGEFEDYLKEFIAECVVIDGISDYRMRIMKDMTADIAKNCEFYQILKKHIQNSSKAVSFLYDNRQMDLFSLFHKNVICSSLYNEVIESFLHALKTYQVMTVDREVMFPAPDILTQAQQLDDKSLRHLFYTYYKQLEGNSHINLRNFKCDELLSACNSCYRYVPFTEILLTALDHTLAQRTLLVNTYAVYVVRIEFCLNERLEHLHSVYLLFEFDRFSSEFGTFFESVALEDLSRIITLHNHNLAHLFVPVLPYKYLTFLDLKYKCDEGLNRIITKHHIKQLNTFFCLTLQIYHCKWILEELSPLVEQSEVRLHKTFTELYGLTIEIVNQYEEYVSALKEKHLKLASNCDQQMDKCQTIEEMAKCHDDFVSGVTDNFIMKYPDRCDLQVIFRMVDLLKGLWGNVRWLYPDNSQNADNKINCDKHEYESTTYIQSLLPLAVVIHDSLVKLKSANE